MISENLEMFLVWLESILRNGVIGYGISATVVTMLEVKIRENFLPIIMKMERKGYKKNRR